VTTTETAKSWRQKQRKRFNLTLSTTLKTRKNATPTLTTKKTKQNGIEGIVT
jgi:hypothetical protein